MESTMHPPILKRVGRVLIMLGLIDIAVMIYCIFNRISYSSSFNIFAVIAGILLFRGSLRTAVVVRWFAAFMLAGFATFLLAWPFLQPINLTLTQLRLYPGQAFITFVYMMLFFGLLIWLFKELGQEPIQVAIVEAGGKRRDMRVPVGFGVGLVVAIGTLLTIMLGGESAGRLKSMAEQQMGPEYHYHVSSMNIAKNNRGTFVSGVVTAWNDHEIRNIPIHWEEP